MRSSGLFQCQVPIYASLLAIEGDRVIKGLGQSSFGSQ